MIIATMPVSRSTIASELMMENLRKAHEPWQRIKIHKTHRSSLRCPALPLDASYAALLYS